MDAYLHNLRELLALLCLHAWASPGFCVAAALAVIALFFGAGTMARVIFGKDTGLFKTFAAKLLTFLAGLVVSALWLTWGDGSLAVALALGGVAALGAVWLSALMLRIPYWPAFGIGVFALGLFLGVARGAGYACKVVADSASKIESQSTGRFQKAK